MLVFDSSPWHRHVVSNSPLTRNASGLTSAASQGTRFLPPTSEQEARLPSQYLEGNQLRDCQ